MMAALSTRLLGGRGMILRWLIATLHLLALPLGLGAIWTRARALAHLAGSEGLARIFVADNLWAGAAILWIATGLWRAFGGLEKGTAYYVHDHAFYVKMGLLVVILLLEIWPMATLIRWRIHARRSPVVNIRVAPLLARVSYVQAGLVTLMVFAATAVARGYFY
jgi:putative membrane protein